MSGFGPVRVVSERVVQPEFKFAGMENLNEVEIPKDVKEKLEEQDEVMKKQLDEDLAKYESGDQS